MFQPIFEIVDLPGRSADALDGTSSPNLILEIHRGRTRFPRRPIYGSRFLIGADARCDLQLGGAGMPPLHSIIFSQGRETWIDCLSAAPPLKVNGITEQTVRVEDGDVIEVGPFRFTARFAALQEESDDSPQVIAGNHAATTETDRPEPALEDLSAAELAELIEEEESLVAELESRCELGAEALLGEIHRRAGRVDTADADPAVVPPSGERHETADVNIASPAIDRFLGPFEAAHQAEAELLHEVDRLMQQLMAASDELEQRAESLRRREARYVDAAEQLLDAQQRLAAQLEVLVEQLPEARRPPQRKSA